MDCEKLDLDRVITFRRQGLLWSEIAQILNCKTSKVKRLCCSQRYKRRSLEWVQETKGVMDEAFLHYAHEASKNALKLYGKALEMSESDSPKLQIEGLRIAYQMTKDARSLVMSERVVELEEKLDGLGEVD